MLFFLQLTGIEKIYQLKISSFINHFIMKFYHEAKNREALLKLIEKLKKK